MPLDDMMYQLPDDPSEAFVVFEKAQSQQLFDNLSEASNSTWIHERCYVNSMLAFCEVYALEFIDDYTNPPNEDQKFAVFFQDF